MDMPRAALVGSLVLAHILFWVFWPLALAPLCVAAVLLWSRWRAGILAAVLLSPFNLVPVFFFAWGAGSYGLGTARLMTYGERGPEFGNLDRVVRCYESNFG